MTRRGCFVGAFWAWGIGLACLILPFLSGKYRGETMHMNGLELMFSEPFNGFLWLAVIAGIVGLICLGSDWSEVDLDDPDDKVPLIACIVGAIGAFCLSKSTDMYFEDDYYYDAISAHGKVGFGKSIAVWCFIGAAACALVAYLLPRLKNVTVQTSGGFSVGIGTRPQSEAELIQAKMKELRKRYLNGQISTSEYAREKETLEALAKEQTPAAPPTGGWLSSAPQAPATDPKPDPVAGTGPRPQYGSIICPNCGTRQKCDRTVCWNCETELAFDGEERVRCAQCGKEYVAPKGSASATCPYCGSTVKEFLQE